MPTAPTQTPTRTAVPTQSRQAKLPHVHPWLRWPLRIYGVLITFVVLALLGNIAVVPLAQGTKDWPAAALGQVAALLTWAQGHQVQTVAGAVVLAALFGLSLVANHEITREQQTAADARSSAVAADAAAAQIDQQLANVAQQVANVMQGQLTGDIERAVAAAQRASAAAPAVPAGVVSPSGLPRPASLVGRERPLADLMAGLRAGDTIGVFAVEGLAGVGKTALAAEAVAQLSLDRVAFPGGAAWISCEGLTGAEGLADLWARVARALGAEAVAALPDPQERRAALRAALADPARGCCWRWTMSSRG